MPLGVPFRATLMIMNSIIRRNIRRRIGMFLDIIYYREITIARLF